MRLEPGEARALPLAAALVDGDGGVVSATPEWAGPCPGTLAFHAGLCDLLVAPDVQTPGLDVLMARLLDELHAAAAGLAGEPGLHARVLAAGLGLVAGRPVAATPAGTAGDVVALALAAIRARTQDLEVDVVGPPPGLAVPAPAAVALAVVQLAVNAQQHEEADRVVLRVSPGPTFSIEWRASRRGPAPVRSHRHALRRARWGWGYVQMVADALGGAALPPGPAGHGLDGACLGLGPGRLTLPLACIRDGVVERATQAWEQDPRLPALGRPAGGALGQLVAAAAREPGRIAYRDLHRARLDRGRTWLALAPESGSSRALDLLRGLRHERALWSAPEPHATRVSALATLLEVAMGEPWPSVPPGVFAEVMPSACASLGVAPPHGVDAVCLPDPRVAAYLLAELGGGLSRLGEEVHLVPGPRAAASPLLQALDATAGRSIRITP